MNLNFCCTALLHFNCDQQDLLADNIGFGQGQEDGTQYETTRQNKTFKHYTNKKLSEP